MLADCEQWLFTEEMPVLPLCTYVTVYMYDASKLKGISGHPRLEQDLSTLGRRAPSTDTQEHDASETLPKAGLP